MEEKERQAAFQTASATEHFVLQMAAKATVSDAAARISLQFIAPILTAAFLAYKRWRYSVVDI